jgi:hypothetical protein
VSEVKTVTTIDGQEPAYMALVRELEAKPEQLHEAWSLYLVATGVPRRSCGPTCRECSAELDSRPTEFVDIVNKSLGEEDACRFCAACLKPEWIDDINIDRDGDSACDDCRNRYDTCSRCEQWSLNEPGMSLVYGNTYCESCLEEYCSYCDECFLYYLDENAADHDHQGTPDCGCEPQELHFQILANSHGVLHEDERLLIELAEGHISDEAVRAVVTMLWDEQFRHLQLLGTGPGITQFRNAVESVGRMWQMKEGNYTKRLSKMFYQRFQAKLDPGLLSRVGSLVKQHAGSTHSWYVEFTRDLNQSASAFFHDGSCWWGSESQSLCAFKHWGGLGIRSYRSEDQDRDRPSGRAWIQPLNEDLQPTQDVFGAHAYIVYNGYGDLEGYTAPRLVAYLTSRSYRKINLGIKRQYVNGGGGYLVGDQETCITDGIRLTLTDTHEKVAA